MFNSSLIYKLYYDWWKNIDKSILLLIILLFSLGLFFSLVSTSLIASDKLDTNSYYFELNSEEEESATLTLSNDFLPLLVFLDLFFDFIF